MVNRIDHKLVPLVLRMDIYELFFQEIEQRDQDDVEHNYEYLINKRRVIAIVKVYFLLYL
jgi:hypothetical protein